MQLNNTMKMQSNCCWIYSPNENNLNEWNGRTNRLLNCTQTVVLLSMITSTLNSLQIRIRWTEFESWCAIHETNQKTQKKKHETCIRLLNGFYRWTCSSSWIFSHPEILLRSARAGLERSIVWLCALLPVCRRTLAICFALSNVIVGCDLHFAKIIPNDMTTRNCVQFSEKLFCLISSIPVANGIFDSFFFWCERN